MKNNLVSWKVITPIIADVVISPWNLLVGGLLISKLNFPNAFLSIILGYLILSGIFYYYGRLGFSFRKNTSQLIEPVFGEKGTKIFFSLLLAFGQIGWFAIVNQIGGESLASLLRFPVWIGIIVYATTMFLMASLNLHRLSIVKSVITVSSLALVGYLLILHSGDISSQQLFIGESKESIIWGISIIVASLMSFCSVSPDFVSKLRTQKDIAFTALIGLFVPGVFIATLGAILFSGKSNLSLEAIIGVSVFAAFGHVFNLLTNTDASIALYTPGNRLNYAFNWPFNFSVGIAAIVGVILSLLNIRSSLEIWLSVVAGIYPSLIGVTVAYYSLKFFRNRKPAKFNTDWRAISIILFSSMLVFFINISLLNWVVAITSFILYIAMTGVTIKIYIGEKSS